MVDDEITVEFDPATRPASDCVLSAVVDAEPMDPLEFESKLYDVIDPDALDTVIQSNDAANIKFPFQGYEISVYGDGRVVLHDKELG